MCPECTPPARGEQAASAEDWVTVWLPLENWNWITSPTAAESTLGTKVSWGPPTTTGRSAARVGVEMVRRRGMMVGRANILAVGLGRKQVWVRLNGLNELYRSTAKEWIGLEKPFYSTKRMEEGNCSKMEMNES
jgi:hypothetical protein